jgi:hypothetical protein
VTGVGSLGSSQLHEEEEESLLSEDDESLLSEEDESLESEELLLSQQWYFSWGDKGQIGMALR